MSETKTHVFAKPTREGLVVRDPRYGDKLPPEGRRVPATSYWYRREKEGSVTISDVDAAPAAPIKSSEKTATKPAKE